MSSQRLFESDEAYEQRQLEEASGTTRRLFESEADWRERALDEAAGTTQRLFENRELYEKRRLEQATGTTQRLFESEEQYLQRARENISGTSKRLFESEADWKKRSLENSARTSTVNEYERTRAPATADEAAPAGAGFSVIGALILFFIGLCITALVSDIAAFLIAIVLPAVIALCIKRRYILQGGLFAYALMSLISFSSYRGWLPISIYHHQQAMYPLVLVGMVIGAIVKYSKRRRS